MITTDIVWDHTFLLLLALFPHLFPLWVNTWQKLQPKYTDFYLFCIFLYFDSRVTTLFVLAVVALLGSNPTSIRVIRLGLLS